MPFFLHDGQRLAYTEHGPADSARTTILLHGLLLSQKMHRPLALALADRGNRVVTLDLLGHGKSDRPVDMLRYSMTLWGEQVIALMDHLEIDQAVVAGTSLGANVTLEAAALAPKRVRGMVLEMPVLDNALLACTIAFAPVMLLTTFCLPVTRPLAGVLAMLPRWGMPLWSEVIFEAVTQDPAPSGAVLQGLVFGRIAPHSNQRRRLETPALVIGHHRDPVHAFSDADTLVEELPDGRLLEASSILELRLAPTRLTAEIGGFIDACWRPRQTAGPQRARVSA